MNILLFGHDSRVHALAWKLVNSSSVQETILAPGNAGTQFFAPSIALSAYDSSAVTTFVLNEGIDLVVADAVAMDAGLVDEISALPLPIIGISKALWPLHRSRCAAREWLQQNGLPVSRGRVCTTPTQAEKYAATLTHPVVVAAEATDGPVIVCSERSNVLPAIHTCFEHKIGSGVIVEELVQGPLVTASILTDGTHAMPVASVRLYPLVDEPYAMPVGAHSTITPLWTRLEAHLQQQIRDPLGRALAQDGRGARGWISATCVLGRRGPVVQSLHLLPSGPEVAVTLPRLESDLLPLLMACARGTLAAELPPTWREEAVVGVALYSSEPSASSMSHLSALFETFESGVLVFHHATTPALANVYVPQSARYGARPRFFAPTPTLNLSIDSSSDSLLAIVVARAKDLAAARSSAYADLHHNSVLPVSFRPDIGVREL